MPIEAVRTPDERFADLPDFPWSPHYLEPDGFDGLRMAYLDEGPRDGHVFLCIHGEPTWSFLYRKMIPPFLDAGARVVAPDLFGFGRSDKPVADEQYTYDFHRRSVLALVDALSLKGVTLVCQDWGGVLGLSLPVDRPELVARLIVMNTALPTGAETPSPGFVAWRDFVASQPDFDVAGLMKRAVPGITDAEVAAYGAPFVDARSKAGVRTFPALVPTSTDMEGADVGAKAVPFWREQWDGPTFMAVGAQDPVLGLPVMKMMQQLIRNCPEPLVLEDAGHFVQERGDMVAKAALEAFAKEG